MVLFRPAQFIGRRKTRGVSQPPRTTETAIHQRTPRSSGVAAGGSSGVRPERTWACVLSGTSRTTCVGGSQFCYTRRAPHRISGGVRRSGGRSGPGSQNRQPKFWGFRCTHGVWVSVCVCLQGLIDSMNDGGDLLRQFCVGCFSS